jgi:hypothetical protein
MPPEPVGEANETLVRGTFVDGRCRKAEERIVVLQNRAIALMKVLLRP